MNSCHRRALSFSSVPALVIWMMFLSFPASAARPAGYPSMKRSGGSIAADRTSRLHASGATQPTVLTANREAEQDWIPAPFHVTGSTYIVSNTGNSGAGSLRQAILDANANPGQDQISFSLPGSGVQTIRLASALPAVTDEVIIDGATQSGYAGKPIVELDGSGAGAGANGLVLKAGSCVVRGLLINRFVATGIDNGMGIVCEAKGRNRIEGCYIGIGADGLLRAGNGGSGIAIFGASSANLIGGPTLAQRNVISCNGVSGIQISTGSAGGNRIINNYIGVNATGDSARGNAGNGIFIDAPNDTVGGTGTLSRNIISANGFPGIALAANAKRALIQGNIIGSDWGTWGHFGNAGNGILILNASDNIIGGPSKAARNQIFDSDQAGILIEGAGATGNIVQGNYIGITGTNYGNMIGIWVRDAPSNTIGGSIDSAGNLITMCVKDGLLISGTSATGTIVQGNRIGGFWTTLSFYGNLRYGIVIDDAPKNLIGGTVPLAANYIQGNNKAGIIIAGLGASGNRVLGNYIGTDINGKKGNGTQKDGIVLAATDNRIGGVNISDGNVIAYNLRNGVYDSLGSKNAILRNTIISNDSSGIDLYPPGITPNDPLDADAGANDRQNYPILDSAAFPTPTSVRIRGRLDGVSGQTYRLDFYVNDKHNQSHFGQGQTWIGTAQVTCRGDGLPNINATLPVGVSIGQIITATATSPDSSTSEFSRELCMLDTDNDGILDLWESPNDGIDWNCDGVIDLNLYAKGARPYHKDLFVEIDYLWSLTNKFKPYPEAIQDVQKAFRSVPNKYVNNPDAADGINLIAEIDNSGSPIIGSAWPMPPWNEFDAIKKDNFGTYNERHDANSVNILEAKKTVYRYCIFGDRYGTKGRSGLARMDRGVAGDSRIDFIVTLGAWDVSGGTKDQQAGTFMHELGHTLGLRHGGIDDIDYKTNYYSVMNYIFQTPSNDNAGSWSLNYSPAALPTLDENRLDELHGLNPVPGDFPEVMIPFLGRDGLIDVAPLKPATSVDFDGDHIATGFALQPVDLNHLDGPPSPGQKLIGFADWPNLKLNFRLAPVIPLYPRVGTQALSLEESDELTPEVYEKLRAFPQYGVVKPKSSWLSVPEESIPVATDLATNLETQIVSDGAGGAIITWYHMEPWTAAFGQSPYSGIYAQRIDSMGRVCWNNNGIMVKQGMHPSPRGVVSDGVGGAIIVWTDSSARHGVFNVYGQRIDGAGTLLWEPAGREITSNTIAKKFTYATLVSDGAGGAVVCWTSSGALYAQRISPSGTAVWPASGVRVGPFPESGYGSSVQPEMAYDSLSGVTCAWTTRGLTSNSALLIQRISPAGAVSWGADGIMLSSVQGKDATFPAMVSDGSDAVVITWTLSNVLFAQRIDGTGGKLWGANHLVVDTTDGMKASPSIVSDGKGGTILAWWDYRGMQNWVHDLYAQHLDRNGTRLWSPRSVFMADSLSDGISLLADGSGGAIAVFNAKLDENGRRDDIYAVRVDASGALAWPGKRTTVGSAPYTQSIPVAVSNHHSGAIIAWSDNRRSDDAANSLRCIYAQNLNYTGRLGDQRTTGIADARPAIPGGYKLWQNYPNPFNPSTTIEYDLPVRSSVVIRVFDILGRCVDELSNEIQAAGHARMTWQPKTRLASGVYFCRIEAAPVGGSQAVQSLVVKMLLLK